MEGLVGQKWRLKKKPRVHCWATFGFEKLKEKYHGRRGFVNGVA